MPKVLESKIIFKSDDQATPNIEKGFDRLIGKMKKVQQEPLITDAQVAKARQQTEKIQEQLSFSFKTPNDPTLITGTGGGAGSHTAWGRGTPPPTTRPLPPNVAYKSPPPTGGGPGGPGINQRTGKSYTAFPSPGQYVDLESFERQQEPSKEQDKERRRALAEQLREERRRNQEQRRQEREDTRGETLERRVAGTVTGFGQRMIHAATGPGEMLSSMTSGVTGGATKLAGMVGGVGATSLLALAGVAALVGGGAMAARSVAQPYLQNVRQFGALRYTMPGTIQGAGQTMGWQHGEGLLFDAMRKGAEFGYSPDETSGLLQQMQRVGGKAGMSAVQPFQRMRWMGMEAENWQPFAGAAVQAGVAKTESDWIRIAKVIGVTITDKSNLPLVMAQLTGLISSFESTAGEMGETGLKQLGIISKWSEATGSPMLTGERGAKFWGGVQQVVAGSKDPHMQMFLYSTFNRNPSFRSYLTQRGEGGVVADVNRDMTAWEFEKARGRAGAPLHALMGVSQMGLSNEMKERLLTKFGMSPLAAEKFREISEKYGGKEADIRKAFEGEMGFKLEDLTRPEGELRAKMAQTQENMLEAGQKTAANVVAMEERLTELVSKLSPFLDIATQLVNKMLGIKTPVAPPVKTEAQRRAGQSMARNYAEVGYPWEHDKGKVTSGWEN